MITSNAGAKSPKLDQLQTNIVLGLLELARYNLERAF